MSIVLTRVDDRLIHGQIVIAWGQALAPDRFVLADDEIAGEEMEHDIYRAGVPAGMTAEFLTIEATARRVGELQESETRTIILLSDVESAVRLSHLAPEIRAINLGGVHEAGGRVRYLPYLHLSAEERRSLAELVCRGVEVSAQDVPTAAAVALGDLG